MSNDLRSNIMLVVGNVKMPPTIPEITSELAAFHTFSERALEETRKEVIKLTEEGHLKFRTYNDTYLIGKPLPKKTKKERRKATAKKYYNNNKARAHKYYKDARSTHCTLTKNTLKTLRKIIELFNPYKTFITISDVHKMFLREQIQGNEGYNIHLLEKRNILLRPKTLNKHGQLRPGEKILICCTFNKALELMSEMEQDISNGELK